MKKVKAAIYLDVPDYQIGEEVMVHFKDTMSMHAVCVARTEPLLHNVVYNEETKTTDIYFVDKFGQEIGRMALSTPTKEFNDLIEKTVQDFLEKQKGEGSRNGN